MARQSRQVTTLPSAGRALPVRLARGDGHRHAHHLSPSAPASLRTALKTYYVAVAIAVGLGVTALYWWEKHDDLADRAARAAAQGAQRNAELTARVAALEREHEALLALASDAMRGDAEHVLAELGAMRDREPKLAATPVFAQLRSHAQEHADQVARFETAMGGSGAWEHEPAEWREISIGAREESWIQIVDGPSGNPIFTKLMKPGERHSVSPSAGTVLITGNAGGLDVSVDGVPAPPFAAKGPARREIALDPARLLAGTADDTHAPQSTKEGSSLR